VTPIRAVAALLLSAGLWVPLAAGARAAEIPGDPTRGRVIFTGKHCAGCHLPRGQSSVGPAVEGLRRPQGAFELAGRLWNHVPGMFAALAREGTEWPRISSAEMADLMAYLEATPARDPPPDPLKGQVVLVRKECLKCHSLRGEGGRIGPDLAAHRSDYDSAAAWAATMWTHTPRMAAVAGEQGVLYPRFSGNEMGNLLGFLRRASGASAQ
jgi:mono/diheme cytochrome c family protein